MAGLFAAEIVQQMNKVRAACYPTARAKPEAMEVESLGPQAIAVLAMVFFWGPHGDLNRKVTTRTMREQIAYDTDLVAPGSLERVLADLAAKGILEIRKESHFFSSETTVEWSDHGRDLCYAYLNHWGWELLYMSLQRSPFSGERRADLPGFNTGPPLVGGNLPPGISTSEDWDPLID